MIGISINITDLAVLTRELASRHPVTIFKEAEKLSSEPNQAFHYYLVFLRRMGTQRYSRDVISSINYLFAHCLKRTPFGPEDLILRGGSRIENDSVLLQDDESMYSSAILQSEIGERLIWGLRYRFSIEDGIEAKISIANLTFAICTEDHPSRSRVFRYDKHRGTFDAILQESDLVARRGQALLATLLLTDHNVWYVVDERIVFAVELSGDDREKWRSAQPEFGTWESRCVRIQDVVMFEAEKANS